MNPEVEPEKEGRAGETFGLERGRWAEETAAVNQALLISGLRQHELTAEAVALNAKLESEIIERRLAEAALQAANHRLADQAGELERLVEARTEKLRQTVAELEGISHSIAHDLRAPLRSIHGFAQLVIDKHGDGLAIEALKYLELIVNSAARMDLLIKEVLNYTQILQSDLTLTSVDLDRLLGEMLSTYPDWQPPKALIRTEEKLGCVSGNEVFLTLCISNVVGNALKFVAPGTTPEVRIRAEELESADGLRVRVWFEDNGIGIASADLDRVFRRFERIHAADRFAGTGIGLTIVRTALKRMGGTVDFTSEPGKGSRFWIELKKAAAGLASSPLANE